MRRLRLPFQRRETRAAVPGVNSGREAAELADVLRSLGGGVMDVRRAATWEAGAVMIEAAFGSLRVQGAGPYESALNQAFLRRVGRALAQRGDSLHLIEIDGAGLSLLPVGSWDVRGRSPDPGQWAYRADLYAPDASFTRTYLPGQVVHCRINVRDSAPWRGRSAWETARDTLDTFGRIEASIRAEADFKPARVVPGLADPPTAGGVGKTGAAAVGLARGGIHLAGSGTQSPIWGADRPGRVSATTIQPSPSDTILTARKQLRGEIWLSMGIPLELLEGGAEGTAQREAFRRWGATSIQPMADSLGAELSAKLDRPITLDSSRLASADMAGRARAVGILTKAGMTLESAREVVGL